MAVSKCTQTSLKIDSRFIKRPEINPKLSQIRFKNEQGPRQKKRHQNVAFIVLLCPSILFANSRHHHNHHHHDDDDDHHHHHHHHHDHHQAGEATLRVFAGDHQNIFLCI